jgi:predicted signal transduction protein with EAL and GGDEF domain
VVLPAALVAVSGFRLVSWFKARASIELEALDLVRRRVRAATVLGPVLTFAFALTMAISTWRDGVVEFALALVAVWVVAAVCAICLNRIASEANVIIVAATMPLLAAFLARGAELTLCLAVLITIAAGFVIRMLEEHFRMFAEIVRSRLMITEIARRRGGARSGDDHRADRRFDRAAQPALLSEPACRPDHSRNGNRRAFRTGSDRSGRFQAYQ